MASSKAASEIIEQIVHRGGCALGHWGDLRRKELISMILVIKTMAGLCNKQPRFVRGFDNMFFSDRNQSSMRSQDFEIF